MKISSLILSILKSILKIPRKGLGEDYLYFHCTNNTMEHV